MPDDPIQQVLKKHARAVDEIVLRFVNDLNRVVSQAQHSLGNLLLQKLTFDKDKLAQTPANQKLLRRLPLLWQQALDAAGLEQVIQRYLASFPAQIPAFHEVLDAVNQAVTVPLPIPKFTAADKSYFQSLTLSAGSDVAAVVEGAANAVITKTVYGLGALSFNQLVDTLVKTTGASSIQASAVADTSLMSFYRHVSAAGFDKIQNKLSAPLKYLYLGPRDQRNRPFCIGLLDQHRSFTRAEINEMDSGAGKGTVFYLCGFWNCRHSWNISLESPVIVKD